MLLDAAGWMDLLPDCYLKLSTNNAMDILRVKSLVKEAVVDLALASTTWIFFFISSPKKQEDESVAVRGASALRRPGPASARRSLRRHPLPPGFSLD